MNEFLHLIHEMSPYLLLGFLVAGLLHAFVPSRLYSQYLSARNLRSVLLAALFGIPLPLCSCGVIPTATSLRREGASKGATTSFLIATPQTGVDSIFATFSVFGWAFALLRPIAALVTAFAGGALVNAFDKDDDDLKKAKPSFSCAADASDDAQVSSPLRRFLRRIERALHYGFVEMLEDIGKRLLIGLLVAGVIAVLVPDEYFTLFADSSLLSIVMILLFSVPMYLCATGSIPIAAALMLKGLSPGAALVLLMAGPAVNMASILVINKVLGRRTLLLYLAAIVGGAVTFALVIDNFLPRAWFVPSIVADPCCHMSETPWFQWGCTILLGLLLLNVFVVRPLLRRRSQTVPMAADERTYRLTGMSCNHCRTNAEKALASVAGVTAVSVSLERKEAVVKGSPALKDLQHAASSLGFELSPLP